jgi:NADH dehydrogenase/NADH:ubiquinone oxidoreductase 75 kD subunit (chain G)
MSEITLQIDGKEVTVPEGTTVFDAAKQAGITIPTLCYHEKLAPYGGCRFCTVEADVRGWTNYVAACLYPVANGIVVRTRSEKIDRIRRMILELLLAHAPDAFDMQDLAIEYGADKDRFEKDSSFCVHCGLCVRYCAEVKKKNAIVFVDKGKTREICFIPEIASKECWECKECFPLCPTEALQAAFVLSRALESSLA